MPQKREASQWAYLLAVDAANIALVMANGQAAVDHQNAINGIEKARYDGYAKAQQKLNDATNAANTGYTMALAQPFADLQGAKADALQAYQDSAADAGKTLAHAADKWCRFILNMEM